MTARRLLPKRRITLAREFRESCRVGPRAWFIVGVAFLLTAMFDKLVWLALILWLLFVLPAVLGGLFSWAVSECIRWISAARTTMPNTAAAASAAKSSPAQRVIDVHAEEVPAVRAVSGQSAPP
jgi:hypothetical protein